MELISFQADENLTEEERKAAWEEFENEKKGFVNYGNAQLQTSVMNNINPQAIQVQQTDENNNNIFAVRMRRSAWRIVNVEHTYSAFGKQI